MNLATTCTSTQYKYKEWLVRELYFIRSVIMMHVCGRSHSQVCVNVVEINYDLCLLLYVINVYCIKRLSLFTFTL